MRIEQARVVTARGGHYSEDLQAMNRNAKDRAGSSYQYY